MSHVPGMLWVKASGLCLVHHAQVVAGLGDVAAAGGGVAGVVAGDVGGISSAVGVAGDCGGAAVVAGGVGGATGAGCWDRVWVPDRVSAAAMVAGSGSGHSDCTPPQDGRVRPERVRGVEGAIRAAVSAWCGLARSRASRPRLTSRRAAASSAINFTTGGDTELPRILQAAGRDLGSAECGEHGQPWTVVNSLTEKGRV